MRVLLVTDAWHPQVNGVVRTLTQMRDQLVGKGHEVMVVGPEGPSISCPTYPEIRLTVRPFRQLYSLLKVWSPDAIHIATEGPLGWAMRRINAEFGWTYTTSFHTRFPEYLKARFHIPRRWTYQFLKTFHSKAECVLVPTQAVANDLARIGLGNTKIWGRGVDSQLFHPGDPLPLDLPRPIQLYVGRLAVEKNIPAFLKLKTGGTKVVVGDGPMLPELKYKYPDAVYLGPRFGHELASIFATADVFVFPSLTDTFGLVMLEALACGTPVAAFPASATHDVISDSRVGSIHEDLASAIVRSLSLSRSDCRTFAIQQSWEKCAERFLAALAPLQASESPRTDHERNLSRGLAARLPDTLI